MCWSLDPKMTGEWGGVGVGKGREGRGHILSPKEVCSEACTLTYRASIVLYSFIVMDLEYYIIM